MEQTECSETSAYKIQTPGNYPEESIQRSEHGESLKSRKYFSLLNIYFRIFSVYVINILVDINPILCTHKLKQSDGITKGCDLSSSKPSEVILQ
jgi:hypothetical protein